MLAPTLFNLYFDAVIHMALDDHNSQGRGVRVVYLHDAKLVGNRRKLQLETLVTDLEYADDMALIADSWEDLKSMLKCLEVCCRDMGLTISSKKTKTLAVLPDNSHPKAEPISLHSDEEVMSNFQYLGSIVQDNCDSSVKVDSRISKASRAFRQLSHILWYQRKIRTRTKLRMFNSAILPILLYSLECTVLLEPQLHRLQSFVIRCLRIILGVSAGEMKRSTAICKMAKQQRLSSILTQRRLRFLGHLSRMCENRLPKRLLVCALANGSREAGGQKCRWNDVVTKDLKQCGLIDNWRAIAQDRSLWRRVIKRSGKRLNERAEEEKQRMDVRKRREK